MRVVEAKFLVSAAGPEDGRGWPDEGPPEVAFVGRSNVGKSTLLQALLGRRGLVRTSSEPGRTRLINFFELVVLDDDDRPHAMRFVDLPGFGYAKVSREERKSFRPLVQRYLERRPALRASVLLVDLRRGAEAEERELAAYLGEGGRSVVLVGTKSDKLPKHQRKPSADRVAATIGGPVLAVSGETGDGLPLLWRRLLVAATAPRA